MVQLLLIASGVLLGLALVAAHHHHLTISDRRWPRLLLGLVPGVIGAILILVPNVDLVPDEIETDLWIAAVVVVSTVAVFGTVYRLAR